uniref:Alpha-1-antitrypsin-like protein GS55-MS n=1 Tax=Marmota marmota marmota TaxID=9994 RepID=A0A8C6EMQ0_MARMA
MLSSISWGLLLLAGLSCLAASCLIEDSEESDASKIAPNLAKFAFRLLRVLAHESNTTNIFFSPVSIATALASLSLGTKADTHTQILEGLGFNLTEAAEADIHQGFHGLFIDHNLKLMDKFLEDVKNLYHSEAFSTNFTNTEEAKRQINTYVEKGTQGKIVDLVKNLDRGSVLALVNYFFFKGKWKYRFDPKDTRIMPFSVSKELSVPVPMMQRLGWFQLQYFRHLHSHALQVPCVCNTTALFILPEKGTVAQVEEALMKDNLDKWTEPFPLNRRKLYFPKLSLSGNYDLDKLVLSPSGLNMFGYGIGLSGISVQTIPIKVSKAVHRVELIVDEEGTDEENVASFSQVTGGPACSSSSHPAPVFPWLQEKMENQPRVHWHKRTTMVPSSGSLHKSP